MKCYVHCCFFHILSFFRSFAYNCGNKYRHWVHFGVFWIIGDDFFFFTSFNVCCLQVFLKIDEFAWNCKRSFLKIYIEQFLMSENQSTEVSSQFSLIGCPFAHFLAELSRFFNKCPASLFHCQMSCFWKIFMTWNRDVFRFVG